MWSNSCEVNRFASETNPESNLTQPSSPILIPNPRYCSVDKLILPTIVGSSISYINTIDRDTSDLNKFSCVLMK